MAITTGDQLTAAIAGKRQFPLVKSAIAGTLVVGRQYGLMTTAGNPGAMTVPSTLAGSNTDGTTLAGAIPYVNHSSTNQVYLNGLEGSLAVQGRVSVYDMVWWNGGITATLTTAQTCNTAAMPARDATGTANGEGYEPWVFVSAVMGAGTPTLTLSYTNTAGTAARTATCTAIASAIAGTMIPFNLQAGDKGVKTIETLTQSVTWTSGTYHLVLLRKLGTLDAGLAGMGQALNFYDLGNKLFDGTCMVATLIPTGTAGGAVIASLSTIEG
jgi:hypothetical protein